MPSFDIVCKYDTQEIENSVNMVNRDITNRYDFRGSESKIIFNKKDSNLIIESDSEMRIDIIRDMLEKRAIGRSVSLKTFSFNDIIMGFLLGVPQLAFGFICVTIGTKTTQSLTVWLLMLLETICAPIWVWIFLNEIPPLSVFIGGSVIISAVVLKSFDKSKEIGE